MVYENGNISGNQIKRMIVCNFLAVSCLSVTDICVKFAGGYGFISLILGGIFSGLYTAIILKKKCKNNKLVDFFLMIKYLILSGLVLSLIAETVRWTLLGEIGYVGVMIPALIVAIYSGTKGIEARARLAQCLFYPILFFTVLLGGLGICNGKLGDLIRSTRVYMSGEWKFNLLRVVGAAVIIAFLFTPAEALRYVNFNKKHHKKIISGEVIVFLVNILFYIANTISVGVGEIYYRGNGTLRLARNAKLAYLSYVRQDGSFIVVFLVSLLMALSFFVEKFFCAAKPLFGRKNIYSYLGAMVAILFIGIISIKNTDWFLGAKEKVENRVEIENRVYADSLFFEEDNEDINILVVVSDEEGKPKGYTFSLENPEKLTEEFAKVSDKNLELGHVKAIFLRDTTFSYPMFMRRIFDYMEQGNLYSDNILMCVTNEGQRDIFEKIRKLQELPGKYIGAMFENGENNKSRQNITNYRGLKNIMYGNGKECYLSRFEFTDDLIIYQGQYTYSKK